MTIVFPPLLLYACPSYYQCNMNIGRCLETFKLYISMSNKYKNDGIKEVKCQQCRYYL